jgi:hypothetical protein
MVGKGKRDIADSLYTAALVPKLNGGMLRHMLTGRRLYVTQEEIPWARQMIEELRLEGGSENSPAAWREGFRKLCSWPMTLSLAGVVIKTMLLHRPGHLGNFTRAFLCCASETFQRSTVELLPIALPVGSAEETELISQLTEVALNGKVWDVSDVEACEAKAKACGWQSWTWLQLLALNAMYCGGGTPRWLTDSMFHSNTLSAAQQEVVSRQEELAKKWTNHSEEQIQVEDWDKLEESLGGLYTGASIGKSYPLTLDAIKPTTPGPGEAARIDLTEVVSDDLKGFAKSPASLRIPDEELVHPRTTAAVQVTSQEEWDKIVSYLVKAKMLEREKPNETLVYKGTAVRNGAFGVHKGWVLKEDNTWLRTLRLIINLIPSNTFQRRIPTKPSERMGYGPSWGALCLHEDEVILCCAEGQKHCFHVYRPGYAWRGFFVLNRKASGACFQDGLEDKAYPRVVSAPMGWSNVVDFIQDGFENLAMRANLEPGRIIRMNEPSPLAPLTTPRDFYSFYVDNFDQFKVVWRTEAGTYEGSPSAEQLQLRQEMETLGVGRDPKKAAESTRSWSSLGAEVDGDLGLIGSSLKFRRALLGANLKVVGEDTVGSHSLGLQSVVSKNMHSVQYKRALACLFDSLYTEMGLAMPKVLSERSKDELLLLSMTLPLHWMSQKMKLEGQIYATDASEEGGGACQSTGLTKWGHSRVHTLAHETAGIEGGGADPILVVECFAGIGGLKQALDLLGLVPMGNIGIDSSSECGKVFRQHCRHAVWYNSIESITFAEVKEWRKKFSKVTKVLLSGGWPCVNHSHLNPRRGGAEAASSQLLDKMLEIKTMLRLCSRELGMPDWEVLEFYENVVMDKHDYKIQSGKIGFGEHSSKRQWWAKCGALAFIG